MITGLFLFAILVRLSSCNDYDELLKPHNLECKESNLTGICAHHDHTNPESSDQALKLSSIIFALSKIANKKTLNEQCFKEFKSIEDGILIKEPWAMKVRDASGEIESGFIWGHNYWLGSKQGCEAVQDPVQITLSDQFDRIMKEGLINQMAPFKMDYRVVYIKHNSPWQVEINFLPERIIHIGLCLPSACSSSEIKNLTQDLLDSNVLEDIKRLELNSEVMYIKDLKLKDSFFKQISFKITIACVIFTLIMIIMAWLVRSKMILPEMENSYSKLFVFIKCFDIIENAQGLFTLDKSSIPVINGLKALSCLWLLISHVVLYMFFSVNNKTFLVSYMEDSFFQSVSIAPLLVDLLFSVSGFLLAYNFIKNESVLEKIRNSSFAENAKSFGKFVFCRYLRLAPLYLVLATMVALFTSYIEDVSVFHIDDRYDEVCSKYWWRNVLFIQNFFDHNELCLNWSWSLACEMEFFFLTTGLLFFYAKHPKIVKNVLVTVIIVSIVSAYIIAIKHHYQFSFDMMVYSCNELYINPFIRIPSYLVGSIGGYYLAKSKGNFEIHSSTEKNIWNLAALVSIACIYSNFKRDLSAFYSITLLIASRLSIAMVGSWMIIASKTGRGCWWSRILEWKIFQNIQRQSYAIYLLNPFIITIVFSLSNSSSYADPLQLCILGIGFCVITYLASIIFSLAFEIPYCNLSRILSKKNIKTA